MTATTFFFFFFNDTATTEIYTLSLHDALPILTMIGSPTCTRRAAAPFTHTVCDPALDRKSTRLNSSHLVISYAVFCLKKKKHTLTSSPRPPAPQTADLHSSISPHCCHSDATAL